MLTAARAVVALVLGMVTTFTPGHSAVFGLVAVGVFGVVAGAVLLAGALTALGPAVRGSFLVQAVVTLVAGVVALVLVNDDVVALVGVVSAWAIVTGALELVAGTRSRGRDRSARDWIVTGALTVALGLAFLLVPPGYSQTLGGLEKVTGTLTASVVLVGILGAWGIVTGVLQAISAVSLRAPAPDGGRA
jgi:uncharacterized membrane protein HdeD (DUF308 family)